MSSVGIFVYGLFVFALVATALGLLAWGIVAERRDRILRAEHPDAFDGRAAAETGRR